LREWDRQYADKGLVVIGNHYPEFGYEKSLDNLKQAISDLKVSYPVVQDNQGQNWNAYHNLYWPTLYLIDKRGHIRYVHIGEGNTTEIEDALRTLLAASATQ
jgi:cytochrome oxidase Cu insertion factor (SCO1/SenC/PrrC family)